jgi:cytidylate kinase
MIPIITIDGPASSGKGTIARKIAEKLGFHYLESGAIYRALGLWVLKNSASNELSNAEVVGLIDKMDLSFKAGEVYLNEQDVTNELRNEQVGMLASKYSAIPEVRQKLLQFQRDFAKSPGLITDGRDMGSVVFPNANLKVFLTASAEKRAQRRFEQLQGTDKSVKIYDVLQDILKRDEADSKRETAPLTYDASFKLLDNSNLSIEETIGQVLDWFKK